MFHNSCQHNFQTKYFLSRAMCTALVAAQLGLLRPCSQLQLHMCKPRVPLNLASRSDRKYVSEVYSQDDTCYTSTIALQQLITVLLNNNSNKQCFFFFVYLFLCGDSQLVIFISIHFNSFSGSYIIYPMQIYAKSIFIVMCVLQDQIVLYMSF